MADGDQPGPAGGGRARKPSRGRRIAFSALGLFGVLLIGFAVLVAFAIKDENAKDDLAQPGECVAPSGFGTADVSIAVLPCDDPKAVYKIATRIVGGEKSCPDGDYADYRQTARIGDDFTLCLMDNWKAGECFHDTEDLTERVACDAGKGEGWLKVTKVVTANGKPGTAKKTRCRSGEGTVFYSEPETRLCIRQL